MSYVVGDYFLSQHGFIVILDKVCHSDHGVSLVGIVEGHPTEFLIHSRIEVANQKVGPELIQNIHVAVAYAQFRLLTLLEGIGTEDMIRLVGHVVWKRVNRRFLVLNPEDWRHMTIALTLRWADTEWTSRSFDNI